MKAASFYMTSVQAYILFSYFLMHLQKGDDNDDDDDDN